ncbi:MAG: septum formation initiator family protein [candidate division NC10 bacterium]|nr:septum formation initiator family protein [candidate division NC10 bacterium]
MAAPSPEDRPALRTRLRLVIILLLALVAASVMGNRGLLRLYEMRRARAALTREIGELAAANAALTEEVRALRTDPARVEAIAREELGLVKPGELVYEFRATRRPSVPIEAR